MSGDYEVLGREATATCLAHRRLARWIPNPGWWIHEHGYRNAGGFGDPRSCSAMWNLPAPIVLVPRASRTADDGTTACTDTTAPYGAHKPEEADR